MADFVDLPLASRYKDTPIFSGTRGPEFGVFVPPSEATEESEDYSIHRLRRPEVGFFDRVATRHFGQGTEILHWFVQLANAVLDPEKEMAPGDTFLVPPRRRATQFRVRSSTLSNG